MKKIGIYIHIPFCRQKCHYCDFISYAGKEALQDDYVEAVKKEIQYRSSHQIVDTIYIGGGTPSLLKAEQLVSILEQVKKSYQVEENAEITIEVNPGTVDENKLITYRQAGVNRLSIGLQVCQNEMLKQIGRIHTLEQFDETFWIARKVGFQNVNVDLMIGLPGQTKEQVEDNINYLLGLDPEHISVYSLIVEEGTVFHKKVERGELRLPSEEEEREQYWLVKRQLEEHGYEHYEISNFAKKGYRSKHNLHCWEQQEYAGFGVAAHSYEEGKRVSNVETLETYIDNIEKKQFEQNSILQEEKQTKQEAEMEYVLLGLRKIQGIEIQTFKQVFGENPIYVFREQWDALVKDELIEIQGDQIQLTQKGIDFANLVWEQFV